MGICEAVKKTLQSQKAYDIMRLDNILTNGKNKHWHLRKNCTAVVSKTWLDIWQNKKGYCDRHEREDSVEHREKVFCPKDGGKPSFRLYYTGIGLL